MRLNAETDSDDPIKGPLCTRAIIMLDSEFVQNVIVADEENGIVIKYKMLNGKLLADEYGKPIREVLCGVVKIIDAANVVLSDVYLK